MIQKAKQLIAENIGSVAVVTPGGVVYTDTGASVRPLFRIYSAHKDAMRGAAVADKIIGKAAASLLCDAGVAHAFAFVMSESALALLTQHGIPAAYESLVPFIGNRSGTGMCPMEQTVADCGDTTVCVARIARFIETVPPPV